MGKPKSDLKYPIRCKCPKCKCIHYDLKAVRPLEKHLKEWGKRCPRCQDNFDSLRQHERYMPGDKINERQESAA